MKLPNSKKIGLIGPFGWGNLGDAAIQRSMIDNIRQRFPGVEIYGYSLNPVDTEKRHGIPSFPISRWDDQDHKATTTDRLTNWLVKYTPDWLGKWIRRVPYEFRLILQEYRNLEDLDAFCISGGGQLDDYWGGAWSHPYTLMKFTFLARLRGAKVYFVSVGAGPLDSRLGRLFDRIALSLANYRSYRDKKSKKYVANVTGFNRDDPVYPDLAFSFQNAAHPVDQESSSDNKIVGIGPMSYFDPRIWPEKDQNIYTNYLNKLAEFILWLVPQGYKILLFPGEAIHDTQSGEDLKEILVDKGWVCNPAQLIQPKIENVYELLGHLKTVDLVVASRFHGVLLSELLYKPLVALSYHPKVDELMADTGQAHYCLQIHDFELETLKARFSELVPNREIASQQIAARVQQYRAALDEQYERIFGNL